MTSVKYFHSGMAGAPQLTSTAGTMLAVLDACLVDGFSSQVVTSVSVSGSVATVTRTGHPFDNEDMVTEISGATPIELNGQKKVLSFSSTAYTFAAPGVADGAATGTITHKVAAAGWSRPFPAVGNVGVYRIADVAGTGFYLRVDDTETSTVCSGRVRGYRTMSDLSSGLGAFPETGQFAAPGMFWARNYISGPQEWVLVSDTRMVYLHVRMAHYPKYETYCFGDFLSRKSPDPYACILTATSINTNGGATGIGTLHQSDSDSGSYAYVPANYLGTLAAISVSKAGLFPVGLSSVSGVHSGSAGMAYPNGADNALVVSPICIGEFSPTCWRGVLPGLYYCPQAVGVSSIPHLTRVTGVSGVSGHVLRALVDSQGPLFIDVTGPWR